jgi:hypothetical protein
METEDHEAKPRLWLASLDRSSPPRQIPNVEGGSPRFGPDGEILFRHVEGKPSMEGSNGFVYRVRPDGTGLRKALEQPVLIMHDVSPDRRWLLVWAPLPGSGVPASQVFPLDGESPVTIGGGINFNWSPDGSALSMSATFGAIPNGRSYLVPLQRGQAIPRIPAGGFHSEEEVAHLPGAGRIDAVSVPGPSGTVYAFYRGATQRNLYRIPIQ